VFSYAQKRMVYSWHLCSEPVHEGGSSAGFSGPANFAESEYGQPSFPTMGFGHMANCCVTPSHSFYINPICRCSSFCICTASAAKRRPGCPKGRKNRVKNTGGVTNETGNVPQPSRRPVGRLKGTASSQTARSTKAQDGKSKRGPG
jgi:hypothetical protein